MAKETLKTKSEVNIERPPFFFNGADVKDHITCVGQKICEYAEHITIDPHGVSSIKIDATIAPSVSITTVKITTEFWADPRVGKGEDNG